MGEEAKMPSFQYRVHSVTHHLTLLSTLGFCAVLNTVIKSNLKRKRCISAHSPSSKEVRARTQHRRRGHGEILLIGTLSKGLLSYFLIQLRNLLHRGGTVLGELGPPHQLLITKTPYRLACKQPDGAFSQTRLLLPRPV